MLTMELLLVAGVGLFAGFLNTVAGGGSLLSLPVLIFLGLDPVVANGTNRVAILFQNVSGVLAFRHEGIFPWRVGLSLAVPAALGSLLGSQIAVSISGALFNRVLAVVMLGVVAYSLWRSRRRHDSGTAPTLEGKMRWIAPLAFFLVGVYGGFIQAGVGFLILAALAGLCRTDLVHANALKVFVVLVYTTVALAMFVGYGKVAWPVGLSLAAGNALGAFVGARFSLRRGAKWIERVVWLTVTAFAAKLFFADGALS